MRARDIRFKGTDDRLLAMAEHLSVDLASLDTRTLPDAVADALIERGIPDTDEARELFADLLRAESHAQHSPVQLSGGEELKRRRLLALGEELLSWAHRAGADLRRRHSSARPLRGLERVFREVARREGALTNTVKHWCMTDPDALRLIDALRPVARTSVHPLQAAWR